MTEKKPITFDLLELATALIRERDIHDGQWIVGFEFNTVGLNIGEQNDEKPAAVVQISKAMLVPFGPHLPKSLAVDAAVVNPPQKALGAFGRKK